ncbi:MAG TPA: flippase [Candidatus Eisenbacteria bacterium]|nr:flippase [Candidatus Eisenbacteria bacterium]
MAQREPARTTEAPSRPKPHPARKLLRQSTLLLVGRILSKLGNFATQILIVRYLSQSTYGGFAYALTIATVLQNLVGLGLERSVTRFLPIYQERGDIPRLFGTIAMTLLTIVSLGLVSAGVLFGLQGVFTRWIPNPETTLPLLLILIFLAPLQAIDDMLVGTFAVFAKARSIFVRRFLLAPVLRLLVASAMVLGKGDVLLLAIGYVASSLLGVAIYGLLLVRVLRQEGLLAAWRDRALRMPWKEVLGFTLPLLTTDLTYAAMTTLSVVLLGHLWNTTAVASLTAVLPAARMNELVMNTFGILFVPLAARMFANEDRPGINALYWRTSMWIAIFTFPVFAFTFSLAEPLTVLLFGERYASSAPILAILAAGCYFNASLGFNGLTLKVFGSVRSLVLINLATIAASVVLSAFLIPSLGPLGAAVSITAALVLYNVLKQLGLKRTGVRLFEPRYLRVYAGIVLCASGLLAISAILDPPVYVTAALALLATWLLVRWNAELLELRDTFPEVLKLPGMGLLLPRRDLRPGEARG